MSSTQARNYHSITFGDKNTWDDWHLIPSSRPEFAAPNGRNIWADIPGHEANGLDISEILTEAPTYENRKGSFQFIVANGYGDWNERYDEIREYLHGKVMKVVLDDEIESQYYYEGRFEVKPWNSGKNWSTITIDYDVGPYKFFDMTTSVTIRTNTQTTLNISVAYPYQYREFSLKLGSYSGLRGGEKLMVTVDEQSETFDLPFSEFTRPNFVQMGYGYKRVYLTTSGFTGSNTSITVQANSKEGAL